MAQPAIDATAQASTKSSVSARDIKFYKRVVKQLVKGLKLKEWSSWTRKATTPYRTWPDDIEIRHEIQQKLANLAKFGPRSLPELELSAEALGYVVAEAWQLFMKHSRPRDGAWEETRRDDDVSTGNPKLREQWGKVRRAWEDACDQLIFEATMVVNWFADVVRRDLDADFFRDEGLFDVGPVTFGEPVGLYVYDDENRPKDLDALEQRVAEIVAPYRALVKERESERCA